MPKPALLVPMRPISVAQKIRGTAGQPKPAEQFAKENALTKRRLSPSSS